jgi:PilZ domain
VATKGSGLKIVVLRCRNAEAFTQSYSAPDGGVELFCPLTTPVVLGDVIVVELVCKDLPNRVMLKGTAKKWRASLPRLRIRAGVTVQVDASEQPKVDFILQTLSGERPKAPRRKHTRLPVGLPVSVRLEDQTRSRSAILREISVNGGLLEGIAQPALGTQLVLRLDPPGSEQPMELAGRVLYHADKDGTGIKFLFREGGGSRRLRELIRRFKKT